MEGSMKFNLSEINAVIRDRRSIAPENYTSRKVHREIIENLINNAIWAPSHGMTQPWRFKVFMEEGVKKIGYFIPELYKAITPEDSFSQRKFDKMMARPDKVSVIIAICMERDPNRKIPEIEEVEAVACAVQNMALTCTAYGLGSFWSSPKVVYTEEMKSFLGLGAEDKCLGLFYIGYPSVDWPKSHRKPMEYVTEWIAE